jgi:hypothetical protein
MAEPTHPSFPDAIARVLSDLADLMQKEMRLAKAEIANKISLSLRAGVWMSAAAVLAIIAVLLAVQAAVFGLSAATGLALHWASLIMAGVLALIAAAFFAKGRGDTPQLSPDRAIHQVKRDIAAAKEQFS